MYPNRGIGVDWVILTFLIIIGTTFFLDLHKNKNIQIAISELKIKCVLGWCIMLVLFGVFGEADKRLKMQVKGESTVLKSSEIFLLASRERRNTVESKSGLDLEFLYS